MQYNLLPFARYQTISTDRNNTVANWVLAVNIVEKIDRFVLQADVPGVDPAKIEISIDADILSLSGERHSKPSDQSESFIKIERSSGKFYRQFTLPETANTEGITAKCSNGILEITIPKQSKAEVKRITVQAA
jgi:HSP20 family protein